MAEQYNTWRGYPVGEEITNLTGWQKEAREKGMMRFFEPIPPAPRPLRDGQGDFVYDTDGNLMTWTRELAEEYAGRSVKAEAAAIAASMAVEATTTTPEEHSGEVAIANVIQLRPAA